MPSLPDFWTVVAVVLALFGIGAAMVAVPNIGRHEFWFSRLCFIAAAGLFETKIVTWGANDLNLIRVIVVAVLGAVVAISLLFGLLWVNDKERLIAVSSKVASQTSSSVLPNSPLDYLIALKCEYSLPPKFLDPNRTLQVYQLTGPIEGVPAPRAGITTGYLAGTGPANPYISYNPRPVLRCTITNFSAATLTNVSAIIPVAFHSTKKVKVGNSSADAQDELKGNRQIISPPINLGPGTGSDNSDFFYITNPTAFVATISLPKTIAVTIPDTLRSQEVQLIPQIELQPFFIIGPDSGL